MVHRFASRAMASTSCDHRRVGVEQGELAAGQDLLHDGTAILQLPQSAKTRPLCARKVRDAELGPMIEAIWVKNYSVYGRRKLATAVRKAGHDVGRDQVARLMRQHGHPGSEP